jgi:hypothetical protein
LLETRNKAYTTTLATIRNKIHMSDPNKHGLPRYIKKEIELKIRQNSKFACVVPNCRNAFYTYEHLIPEFNDASEHDPEKICLACPNHNPRREGPDGQANFSKQQLIEYYEQLKIQKIAPDIRNHDFFYGFKSPVEIKIGESTFRDTQNIINVNGQNVLSFLQNRNPEPFEPEVLFTGVFNRPNGETLFKIKNNEWISDTRHWDVETKNGRIKIHNREEIVFEAQKIPKYNRIEITKLNLWYNPFHIVIQDGSLFIGRVSEKDSKHIYININGTFEHNKCAIYLTNQGLKKDLDFYGFEISGNNGATLFENGIHLGKGGGIMGIRSFQLNKSKNIVDRSPPTRSKTLIPKNGNYFVTGVLEERIIDYPLWTESEYWLNDQKLDARPNSWGIINEEGEHLYYLSSGEKEDFALNEGFIGFFANDLLNTDIQDKVFEVEIEETDSEGLTTRRRIKRFDIANQKIISELNHNSKRFYHPHQFAGVSPWKKEMNNSG